MEWQKKRIRCGNCQSEWDGMVPEGTAELQCPSCRQMLGRVVRRMLIWMLTYEDESKMMGTEILSLHTAREGAEAAKLYDMTTTARAENWYSVTQWEVNGSELLDVGSN